MKKKNGAKPSSCSEYMLLVGSSATSNTNDLSQADFLKPDTELRKEAMLDQEVRGMMLENNLFIAL
jgi:hypothetical protein